MSKFTVVTLTAVALSFVPTAATAKVVRGSNVHSAVAIQSVPQLSEEATNTIETHGEPLSLICLGALFVGSALLFSMRRSNA